jgi:succinate-semialdehyde dehydrogenase/glutarate-semialdehyde dehydrogenase
VSTLGTNTVVTVNPATGKRLAEYPAFSGAEVDAALDRAAAAQTGWAALPFPARAEVLHRAAEGLRRGVEDLALLVTREMGKPLAEARAEVEKCATACDFYAEHAADLLADEPVATSADRSWIGYEPVGVVLAVMPWNFPLWQVLRFAAPALMAGNAALLKHSPNTTGCALAVQRVLADAGAPAGLFTALVVAEPDVPAVIRRLIDDPRIGAVTITGSGRAGSAVGSAAGAAVKKSVLELGGSDPFVVLADADLPRVAAMAARGRYLNAGQSCISPKRFVVDASVAEEFTRLLVAEVQALTVGDPEAPGTDVGPMAREDLLDGVHRQVEASVDRGARLLVGGERLAGAGWFYAPTVLADVAPGQPAYDDEVFGPVAAVIVADGEDDAVRIANDTRFGLGASVWTADPERGVAVARRIRSGAVFVNAVVASDVRMPFGGTRASGYGRELSAVGIREFVDVRTWWVLDEPADTAPASE